MKYLFILLVFAACTSDPKPKRPNVEPRIREIKAELKHIDDSVANAPATPAAWEQSDSARTATAKAEGLLNRRVVFLQIEHDSLANLLKKYEMDSAMKNR